MLCGLSCWFFTQPCLEACGLPQADARQGQRWRGLASAGPPPEVQPGQRQRRLPVTCLASAAKCTQASGFGGAVLHRRHGQVPCLALSLAGMTLCAATFFPMHSDRPQPWQGQVGCLADACLAASQEVYGIS